MGTQAIMVSFVCLSAQWWDSEDLTCHSVLRRWLPFNVLSVLVLAAQYGNRWLRFVQVPVHWRDNNVFLPRSPGFVTHCTYSVRFEQAHLLYHSTVPLFFCFYVGFFFFFNKRKNKSAKTIRSKAKWYRCFSTTDKSHCD